MCIDLVKNCNKNVAVNWSRSLLCKTMRRTNGFIRAVQTSTDPGLYRYRRKLEYLERLKKRKLSVKKGKGNKKRVRKSQPKRQGV